MALKRGSEVTNVRIIGDVGAHPGKAVSPKRKGPVRKKAISAPEMLNEAYNYKPRASSFSRGLRVDMKGFSFLFISGTASVDKDGKSIHVGDFKAQTRRAFENVKALLESEGASWHDVVKTTCYLRDIDRDYAAFNEVRTQFYKEEGLDPLPASVGVQANICRSDLLVEIEALAIIETEEEEVN